MNFIPNSLPSKSKSTKVLLLSLLVLTAFSFIAAPPAHAASSPSGCTTPGLGISKAVFVNGLSSNHGSVGDTLTYQVTVGLVTGTDCNVQNATIYFLYPNNVKADNACGGFGVCDVSGDAGVVTVATNVNITRALVTDSITTATCQGNPAPVSGCTWNVPGSYTISLTDAVNNGFDGFSCTPGISNPCQVVGLTNIKDLTLTDPTGVAAAQGGIQVSVLAPHISVVKTTTPKVEVGGSISVTATVTNDGNEQLTGVTAVDDHAGPLTCGTTTLAAGASTTCTGSFTAPGTPGTVTNTVTVTGSDSFGHTVTNTATATTTVIQVGVSITKTADAKVEVGGTVHWSAVITNTGTTAENINVTDVLTGGSNPSAISCTPTANGGSLAVGANTTCSGTYTAPGTPGSISDQVSVAGVDQTGATATASASATTLVIQPAISVTKSATAKVEVGGAISVSATVTNTGSTTLTGITATDDHAGALTCGSTTLAAGANTTCTGTYTAPGTAGTVTDTVTATGQDQTGAKATATASATTTVVSFGISVTKTATAKVEVGGTISVSANVTNTGGSTLTGITATDDHAGALTCGSTTLAAGASTTCTGSYTAPSTPGTVTDTVTASGSGQIGSPVTATATATTTVVKAGISVTKTATPKAEVNGTISVSATVTNSGTSPLTGVAVTDDHAGALTCGATTLAVNASTTCTGSYTAPGTPGTVTDTVTATGTDQTGASATATASATTTLIQVGIAVTKSCTPSTQTAPGTITWTIVITNSGSNPSETVTVNDSLLGSLGSFTLASGASQTITVTQSSLSAATYNNTVTAMATDQTGATATATASATCTVTPPAQVTRTYGYWAQHWRITQYVLETDLGGSISWGCVTLGSGDSANVATGDVLAGMTASIPKTSTGGDRTALDQARMQLAQQLIAAILNNAAFGSSPGAGVIAAAESAYCGSDASLILHYVGVLDQFNQSGDNLAFPASADSCPPSGGYQGKCLSIIADPKGSQALAKPEFPDWDTPGNVHT